MNAWITANTKQLSGLEKSPGFSRNMPQLRLLVTPTAQERNFEFQRLCLRGTQFCWVMIWYWCCRFRYYLTGLQCSETVSNENCQKEKCKMTFISRKTQKQLQDKLTTLMNKLTSTVFSDSCKETLNKLACASYTPPCDGTYMKTLCKYRCSLLFDDCPEAFDFTEVSSYCAEPAQGDTTSGFCELTRWPSARHWDKGSCASLQISVKF